VLAVCDCLIISLCSFIYIFLVISKEFGRESNALMFSLLSLLDALDCSFSSVSSKIGVGGLCIRIFDYSSSIPGLSYFNISF